jgi:hypothetical protein
VASGIPRDTAFSGFVTNNTCLSPVAPIVSQTNTLTALTNMGQLGSLMENMTATLGASAVKGFYGWMLSVLDADMARRVMDAAGAGAGAGKAVS